MTYLPGVRLPTDVEKGAQGGPRFSTAVLPLDSGYEQRNANWQDSVGRWDVGYGLMEKYRDGALEEADVDVLTNFFYIVRGRAFSFRFKDWSDYEIGYKNGNSDTAQFLGEGDGATSQYQAFKRYTFAGFTHDRLLNKLVDDGTIEVLLEAAPQTEGVDYTVNYDTGIITMTTPPAATGGSGSGGAEVLTFRANFDVHARLDIDDLNISVETFRAGAIPNMPLMELLGTGL